MPDGEIEYALVSRGSTVLAEFRCATVGSATASRIHLTSSEHALQHLAIAPPVPLLSSRLANLIAARQMLCLQPCACLVKEPVCGACAAMSPAMPTWWLIGFWRSFPPSTRALKPPRQA